MTRTACVDLFCGAGGLTHGLTSAGVNVIAGVDVDQECRYPYETNNSAHFVNRSVSSLTAENLVNLFGNAKIRILAGCAPCQPFSTYSYRYDIKRGGQWSLLNHFGRLVRTVLPDLVVMENVPLVYRHEVFLDFIRTLTKKGYYVHHDIVDCASYGLPQKRRRMVLLASLHGKIGLVRSNIRKLRTVRTAIGGLPPLTRDDFELGDPLNVASRLSRLNLKRIQASKPGGTWHDWPESLLADCHRRETGRTYPGVYGRMSWDEPAPTLTTQFYGFGNGRFGHPEQDRALSLREGAILQGFPKSYSFVPRRELVRFKILGRMIGNAVPVTLGAVIGRSIVQHIGK